MGFFQSLTDGMGITDYAAQEGQMGLAQSQFAGLEIPELSPIELQRMVSAGEITPELAEIIKLEGNAYKDIYVDPRLKAQQMETLGSFQELSKTGMSATDRADLAKIASEEGIAERGSRESILQQAQMRGLGGSGLELAAQLENQQGGATRRSARDTEVAGQAAQRKIQALEQAGNLAGQLRSQDYGEQAEAARAQQALNQFNAQNTQSQLQRRADAQNTARAQNLSAQQNLMNQNVGLANQEEMYKQQIPQQNFQNQVNLAGQKAGGHYQMAGMLGQQSSSGLSGAAGLAGAAAMAFSDEECKENIKLGENEIDKLLEDLTGYAFSYKPEYIEKGVGTEGKKVGVMADDLQGIIPDTVKEVDVDGQALKALDNKEILPAVLASVGRLHDRLKKVEG